ncbi:hypothetical protein ABBQ38_003238 [Trebouxia sp. C0009 RCD-2024]
MQNSDELHLRAELRGHEEDVRAVITCPLGLVTASRDKTVRVWTEGEDHQFSLDKSMATRVMSLPWRIYQKGLFLSCLRVALFLAHVTRRCECGTWMLLKLSRFWKVTSIR